jgi:hypothetical protein
MSTTEQRTGFRLPWNTDTRARDGEADSGQAEGTDAATPAEAELATSDASTTEAQAPSAPDAAEPAAVSQETAEMGEEMSWPDVDRRVRQTGRRGTDALAGRGALDRRATPADEPRRANPLLVELSKAMHAVAEVARTETLAGLAADANARIEAIRSSSADEAANIKQTADADISAARDWSKSELARIREETERRIATRRAALETEIEAYTARVERRIKRVRRMVSGFETQMASFFETLLAEEDPTQVAFLAEQLPDVPSLELDDELEDAFEEFEADAEAVSPTEVVTPTEVDMTDGIAPTEDVAPTESVATEAEAIDDDPLIGDAELSVEGAAAAEAEALASLDTDLPAEADEDTASDDTTDQPTLPEEVIAASLAKMDNEAPSTAKTEVIVTGLVSVAGIAGFKRAVSRITGVSAVGVTSGPGGEFVYAVTHGPETDFKSAISALPGFAARLTGESEGVIRVTASDRDADH